LGNLLCVLAALACWRITSLLYREHWLDGLREWCGVEHDADGPAVYRGWLATQIFECFWCLSLIVALPFAAGVTWAGGFPWWFSALLWPALSAATIWLETRTGHFQTRQ